MKNKKFNDIKCKKGVIMLCDLLNFFEIQIFIISSIYILIIVMNCVNYLFVFSFFLLKQI